MLTEAIHKWVQIVAIMLAGSWAVFEYMIKEENIPSNIIIDPVINIRETVKIENIRITPLDTKIQIENKGKEELFIVFSYFEIRGRKINITDKENIKYNLNRKEENENVQIIMYDTETDGPILNMRDFDQGDAGDKLGESFFNPQSLIDIGEKIISNITILIKPEDKYNMISYDIETIAITPCKGIYPFETCYEFRAEILERKNNTCQIGESYFDFCINFYRRNINNKNEIHWQPTTLKKIEEEHEFYFYNSSGIKIL